MSDKLLIALLEQFSIQKLRLLIEVLLHEGDDAIYLQKDFDIQNLGGKKDEENPSIWKFATIVKKFLY
ncbi:hypothetical protein LCGC14_0195090 [marine sediment metagenome]|uniref:Uncharacterized protein n=1 Tax=marine sediment metagenome TaxID=412755 RepID=A0A0F9X4A4_9ZZZZ